MEYKHMMDMIVTTWSFLGAVEEVGTRPSQFVGFLLGAYLARYIYF